MWKQKQEFGIMALLNCIGLVNAFIAFGYGNGMMIVSIGIAYRNAGHGNVP